MEILFENSYTRNKEWAKDVFRYIRFKRPIAIILFVAMAVCLAAGLFSFIVSGGFPWLNLIVSAVFLALMFFVYFRDINLTLKRDIEVYGKALDVTVTVTAENITQTLPNGSETHLNYADIKKAVATKNYIYLWSKANLIYSLKKNAFSVGDTDGFLGFLKNKGIKVK